MQRKDSINERIEYRGESAQVTGLPRERGETHAPELSVKLLRLVDRHPESPGEIGAG